MPTYMMRAIDPDLWRKVKSRAAADGVNMRGLILWLLALYAKRGLTPFEAIDGKCPRSTP